MASRPHHRFIDVSTVKRIPIRMLVNLVAIYVFVTAVKPIL